jgi:hypothetical protein
MPDNYIIEIRPKSTGRTVQAGIVVRDGDRFRFFAAIEALYSLESQLFKNPKAAEDAALRHVATLQSRRSLPGGDSGTQQKFSTQHFAIRSLRNVHDGRRP